MFVDGNASLEMIIDGAVRLRPLILFVTMNRLIFERVISITSNSTMMEWGESRDFGLYNNRCSFQNLYLCHPTNF